MKLLLRIAAFTTLALSGIAHAQSDVLIAPGSNWKYLDDGSDQGAAWQGTTFDDTTWSAGNAQLGYGDGDEVTVVSYGGNPAAKHITTYFRHAFAVPDPSAYETLTLELLRDDGAVVYLNGVELVRSTMPAGAIDFTTLASWTIDGAGETTFYTSNHDASPLVAGTNVVAVEIHQASAEDPDISFDLCLVGHPQHLIMRGPYLQQGSESAITVRWRSFPASNSQVWYGPAPGNLTMNASDAAVVEDHEMEITGLAADTTYYYAIGSSSGPIVGDDSDHFFVTHPALGDPRPARYWILGDSGTVSAEAAAVRDAYDIFTGPVHTDLWLMLGDNAYLLGTDADYQAAVFDFYPDMLRKSVLWPARGNWDSNAATFYGMFTFPTAGESGGVASGTEAYSSFDHGRVHFIRLDSTASDRSVGGPMWTWLQSDLAATAQEWVIAFWHHPPYSKGAHDSDVEVRLIEMRENFGPLLESGGVDLVICADSHSYERSLLVDGHYGFSNTLDGTMLVDSGDGQETGDGAYNKAPGPNGGSVYVVCGSSGGANSISTLHPVMETALGIPGSLVIDVAGGRLDATFLSDTGVVEDSFTLLSESYTGNYCVAQDHSEGCAAEIVTSGVPSATNALPFSIDATLVPQNKFGLLFYGYTPTNVPFFNGVRCVAAPITRTAVQNSGGAGPCTGGFTYDFNARIQGGMDSALVPGATVYSQYWYRDGGLANTSDAHQFVIGP